MKKIIKATLIYDAYEFYPLYFQRYTPYLASFFYSLERRLAKRSDLLITWYPTIATFVRQRYGVKNVIVFPNLPPPWFHSIGTFDLLEERSNLGIDKEDFVVLYAGALLADYVLTELLEACDLLIRRKAISKIKVLIAARDIQGYPDLKRKIEELSLETRCIFVGFRPYSQIPHLYQLSDLVYAMYKPEKDHLFLASGKIFEAMVSKKPVLTCDKGEKKRIVEEARCGFAIRPTAHEIAEAIQFLSENRSKAVEMGSAGHHYFDREFSWEKVSNRLRSAYLALVESKC